MVVIRTSKCVLFQFHYHLISGLVHFHRIIYQLDILIMTSQDRENYKFLDIINNAGSSSVLSVTDDVARLLVRPQVMTWSPQALSQSECLIMQKHVITSIRV